MNSNLFLNIMLHYSNQILLQANAIDGCSFQVVFHFLRMHYEASILANHSRCPCPRMECFLRSQPKKYN